MKITSFSSFDNFARRSIKIVWWAKNETHLFCSLITPDYYFNSKIVLSQPGSSSSLSEGYWSYACCYSLKVISHQIQLAGIDQILQINAYLIRVHALAGAKCFSDVLGVYVLLLLKIRL